ncbi:DNA primase DnaG [uncultured archaeon]|nr:DNA primase DnaG [uncultured archaeon]
MAKISPVSIKYMIHANFEAEGALEKPDVIGALFGQTEGLLGNELEMRELQKEGKIGRIEVELQKDGKRTIGVIKIPTALDQSETTLIAAAIETIERIGPSDSRIEIEKIEDVRGSKRDYIVDRAKKLLTQIQGSTDSREISNEIKSHVKLGEVEEFGDDKVAAGDLTGNEIILVEGRADLVNLMKNGVRNVVAMNGTKLPQGIKELSQEKEITLYVDGDRGGKLIIQNVLDNAKIKYIAMAPDGKEVEELTGKEILMTLRKKIPVEEYLSRAPYSDNRYTGRSYSRQDSEESPEPVKKTNSLSEKDIKFLEELSSENAGSGKAVILDENLKEMKAVSVKTLVGTLRRIQRQPRALVIDGTVTGGMIEAAEEVGCAAIVAKNFAASSKNIQMLSL